MRKFILIAFLCCFGCSNAVEKPRCVKARLVENPNFTVDVPTTGITDVVHSPDGKHHYVGVGGGTKAAELLPGEWEKIK